MSTVYHEHFCGAEATKLEFLYEYKKSYEKSKKNECCRYFVPFAQKFQKKTWKIQGCIPIERRQFTEFPT